MTPLEDPLESPNQKARKSVKTNSFTIKPGYHSEDDMSDGDVEVISDGKRSNYTNTSIVRVGEEGNDDLSSQNSGSSFSYLNNLSGLNKNLKKKSSNLSSHLSSKGTLVKRMATGQSENTSQGHIIRMNSESSDGGMASVEMAEIDDHQSGGDNRLLNTTIEEDTGGHNDSPLMTQQSAQGPP